MKIKHKGKIYDNLSTRVVNEPTHKGGLAR